MDGGKRLTRIIVVSTIFIVLSCGSFIAGCSNNEMYDGDADDVTVAEEFPMDTGGPAIVIADRIDVYPSIFNEDNVHTLRKGSRLCLIAEYCDPYPDGWRKIRYRGGDIGWIKNADQSNIDLLYYVVSENSALYPEPGKIGAPIVVLDKGAEVKVLSNENVEGEGWVKINYDGNTGWVKQSDVADGLFAFSELAYYFGAKGDAPKTIRYLKQAEEVGAFVDYCNASGPWSVRVPGRVFRVFGRSIDYQLNEDSTGSVAVDKTGKYLAFGRSEDKENYLRIYDLSATDEVFYSPDLNDFSWSPVGQFLAYTEGVKGVYSLRMFWTSRGTVMKSFRLGGDYGWSPDGTLIGFTGLRTAESAEYYLPASDDLPLDNVFTTIELYDPFGMRWSMVKISTPYDKYEFVGWKSNSIIIVNRYRGEIGKNGIVIYDKKPFTEEWPIDRGSLVSPQTLSPDYKESNTDGGAIDDQVPTIADTGGDSSKTTSTETIH